MGAVAYKLQLLDDYKIHSVVHVSQLKRHIPPSGRIEDDINEIPDNPVASVQPQGFLDFRTVSKGCSNLSQILVQWDELPGSLTTWEEVNDLRRRFPRCAAWGQAAFREGGNVRCTKSTHNARLYHRIQDN